MSQYRFYDNLNTNYSNNWYSLGTDSFGYVNCSNAPGSYTIRNRLNTQILTWLSPLEPRLRHRDIRESRVEDVGEWVLETEEFKGWCAGSGRSEPDNAVLFCYGDPGVGKTFVSSLVIDRLYDQAREQNATVTYFYLDPVAKKERSPTNVLGAILKQVVREQEEMPEEIAQAYKNRKSDGRGPELADILKMLQATASKNPTFICIDGIDECLAGYRVQLLDSLNKVLRGSPGTRIFMTGRPQIQAEIERRLSRITIAMRIALRRHDIISYLHSRLDEDTTPEAMDSSLNADILKKIPEDISQTFLLLSLGVDTVLRETTISDRRQRLNEMTGGFGLEDAYGEMLSRIRRQGEEESRLGMATLMWISHSERPLRVDELCYALGVEIGSLDLEGDSVPSIRKLLACCQGLVTVDREASTVRLIHLTLQEYIQAHPELFDRAHSTMAETCLSYLNSHQVNALSANLPSNLRRTPFLEYSSLYWGMHAKRELSDCGKRLVLKLFENYSNHISAEILLREEKPDHVDLFSDELSLFSRLHCASFFGIVEIVTWLVEVGGCDINQADCIGSTPLVWAALNGHEWVVKILLGQESINPDKPNQCGETPLWCASRNGHEGVVKILLGQDINPNRASGSGETPLWCAAKNGHEGVVAILLERNDIDPDKPDKDGRTPLWFAAETGHEQVVKILLGRDDVNADKPDKYGATPLWCAASSGHEEVVKILLRREGVNHEKSDISGKTPLVCARQNGHEGVVKILNGREGVGPEKPDNDGETLLLGADDGCEGAARIQPGHDVVHPHKPDNDRRNPLRRVAKRVQARVRALLQRPASTTPTRPTVGEESSFSPS